MDNNELAKLTEEIKKCKACHLYKTRTQVVPGTYGERRGLCFVGEAPGFYEDQQGLPFVGRSGKLLDKMLDNIGYKRGQVSILNVVKCRPTNDKGENRTPTIQELNFCGSRWLGRQLGLLSPKLVVTLGGIALKFFFPKTSVTKEAGKLLTTEAGLNIFVTYHPAYILRNYQMLEQYEEHFLKIKGHFESSTESRKKSKRKGKQPSITDYF